MAGDTSFTDTINKSYSFFPELETWQKIQNGQVIRIADAPNQALQVISQSLLSPFEFHYYSDNIIKIVIKFNPQLCYCNGRLYGKSRAHIGRVYLLPRTLDTNNNPINFYLYISPDYIREYDTDSQSFANNDGWNEFIVAPLSDNSVGIFTPQNDGTVICKKAENGLVLTIPSKIQLDYSIDNGVIFFDGFTGSNLVLNNQGASFLYENLSYRCKGLRQWFPDFVCHETRDYVSSSTSFHNIRKDENNNYYFNASESVYTYDSSQNKVILLGENDKSVSLPSLPDIYSKWKLVDDTVQIVLKVGYSYSSSRYSFYFLLNNMYFYIDVSSLNIPHIKNVIFCRSYYNVNNVQEDSNGNKIALECTHVICLYTQDTPFYLILRTELHPEIFDFNAEIERSRYF